MSKPLTIYGFLLDDALYRVQGINTGTNYNQGYCILEGEAAAYIVNPVYLDDTRSDRQGIVDRQKPKGKMRLVFDRDRISEEGMKQLSAIPDISLQRIMNIMERIYLQQNISDSGIEQQLITNSGYKGYVPESFLHSTAQGSADVTTVKGQSTRVNFMDWYEFKFTEGEDTFTFHFWVGINGFKRDYPFTTITRVIPPYDIKKIIDPEQLLAETNIAILTDGSGYIFNQTNLETIARDQNGVFTFRTKYVISEGRNVSLPFAFPYCGAKEPSTLDCREYLKKYIKEETGIGDEELGTIFPELFDK